MAGVVRKDDFRTDGGRRFGQLEVARRLLWGAAVMFATTRNHLFASSTLLVCALAACADARGPIVEPGLGDSKSDVLTRVIERGPLGFDEPRRGEFTEDLQFQAYRVAVRAGAVVTFDNTHKGTAAALDTTMFLYGPFDGEDFGTSAIAFDDDSGWSRHARIREFAFQTGGQYLVVLGTRNGLGRGRYRLEARCESGSCAPIEVPDRAEACDPRLLAYINDCVDEQLADFDPESDPLTPADAVSICTDAELLGPAFDDVCLVDPGAVFCSMTFENFVSYMAPVCAGEAALEFPVDVLGLVEQPVPHAVADSIAAGCPGDCALSARLLAYTPYVDASLPAAVASVWARFSPEVPGHFTARVPAVNVPAYVVDAAAALDAGVWAEYGVLDTDYPVAPGASAYHAIFVVHDPVARKVLVVERIAYD